MDASRLPSHGVSVWRHIHDYPQRKRRCYLDHEQIWQNGFWQILQLWKDAFAHREEVAALALHPRSIVSFHVSCSSCQPCGASFADLPEAGVKSRVFQGQEFDIRRIVAFFQRYGFLQKTVLGQRSDSMRPVTKGKWSFVEDAVLN